MKTDDIANTCQVPDKYPIISVKLNTGGISFVFHCVHGLTPIDSKKRLASVTL
jgi:hypothetical protein